MTHSPPNSSRAIRNQPIPANRSIKVKLLYDDLSRLMVGIYKNATILFAFVDFANL